MFYGPQDGKMADISVTPQLSTASVVYVYTVIYITEADLASPCPNGAQKVAGVWCPFTLPGTLAVDAQGRQTLYLHANSGSNLILSPGVLAGFSAGNHFVLSWDWTWNGSCWLGPGSSTCGTGNWRLQQFTLQ